MFGTYRGRNTTTSDCNEHLLFDKVQPWLPDPETYRLQKTSFESQNVVSVSISKELLKCPCAEGLKVGRKYALMAIGRWEQQNSRLAIVKERSVLLRKHKLRQSLYEGIKCHTAKTRGLGAA